MTLTLRPTGLASPAYQDRQDWTVFEDGKEVGRIYEDGLASAPTELRWLVITVYVRPDSGIVTSGKVPTIDDAKAEFQRDGFVPRMQDQWHRATSAGAQTGALAHGLRRMRHAATKALGPLLMRARALATVRVWKKRLELQAHSRRTFRGGCGLPVATGVRS
jgi:hypothetical protein